MSDALLNRLYAPCHSRAVVTGGGSGIGRAVALGLAQLGVDVYVMGRRHERLEETRSLGTGAPGRIVPIRCDIREPDTVSAAFDRVEAEEPAPILVHAAAEVGPMPAERLTPEMFRETISSQLNGTFNIVHRWSQPLIAGGHAGVALAYSSALCGRETPLLAHSSASKAGVESMIRTMASEWGRFNLRLNVIGPGLFPIEGVHHEAIYEGPAGKRVLGNIPLARAGTIDEIAGPSLFMLSRSASYVTGEVFIVDGGLKLLKFVGPAPEDYA